jgi:hypothetical protein
MRSRAGSETTLAQILKQTGYATGMCRQVASRYAKSEYLPTRAATTTWVSFTVTTCDPCGSWGREANQYPLVQATLTKRYTERAVKFIGRTASSRSSCTSPAMPHKPLACSEDFYKKSARWAVWRRAGRTRLERRAGAGKVEGPQTGWRNAGNVLTTTARGTAAARGPPRHEGHDLEGGYRVPCIVRWPGAFQAGKVPRDVAV